MQIKKFTAATIKEAMQQVRAELGSDAVILKTKKVPKEGALGRFLGKEVYEIIATVDSDETAKKSFDRFQDKPAGPNKSFYFESSKIYPENIKPPVQKNPVSRQEPVSKSDIFPREETGTKNFDELKNRMDSFLIEFDKKVSEKFLENSNSFDLIFPQLEKIEAGLSEMRELINTYNNSFEKKNMFSSSICMALAEHEVEEEIIESIFRNMDPSMKTENIEKSQIFFSYMDKLVSKITKYSGGLEIEEGKPRVIALVGPTGVGKTTTIAKLAADVSLVAKKNVVVFSIDTFRIGAQEQLKTYCDILSIPLEVVKNSAELNEKLLLHKGKDLILIDTVGRGSYDIDQIKGMSKFFKSSELPVEINLVLSAVTKWSDLKETLSNFRNFNVSCLLFTKLDETKRYGNIFNLAVRTQIPVSYITTGQNVPEDIEIMSSNLMTALLLKRYRPSEKLSARETEKLITI